MGKQNKKFGKKVITGLGTSMIKAKNRRRVERDEYIKEHRAEEQVVTGKKALESVLERDTVSDFIYNADINQLKFDVSIQLD